MPKGIGIFLFVSLIVFVFLVNYSMLGGSRGGKLAFSGWEKLSSELAGVMKIPVQWMWCLYD